MQRFIAIISHEIRTPLNTIIGLAYLASNLSLPSPGAQYVDDIHTAGNHLHELVNRVLDFSALRAGKMALQETEFEFDSLVERLTAILRSRLANRRVEIVFDIADDVPARVIGDPVRLFQVLVNFLYNAVKFTHDGFIELSIRVASKIGARVVLLFAVKDTGEGIPPDVLGRLFEEYEQGGRWLPREDGGTGLGLAINREIVRLMGGEIEVESVLGEGSVFRFTAVFEARDEPCGERAIASKDVRERRNNALIAGARVLLVDDNPSARGAIGRMLRSFGLSVEIAESGALALDLVRDAGVRGQRFDFILLDETLSDPDGKTLSLQLGEVEPVGESAVHVLLTSKYQEPSETLGAARIDATLSKPVTASRLYDALVMLAPRRQGAPVSWRELPPSGVFKANDLSFEERRALVGRRILVVDDSVMNLLVAQGILEAAECQVDVATNGADAYDAACKVQYDAIVMDMNMPVMDGLEATQKIRAASRNRNTPVIGCTASTLREDVAACRAAGMSAVVAKPISPNDLYYVILTTCENPGAAQ